MPNQDVLRLPEVNLNTIAEQIPTPFFLYEENRLRANLQRIQDVFSPLFAGFAPLYAVKANPNPHILQIVQEAGFGFDCSSPSEVYLAGKLGAHGMHTGNYLTTAEIAEILSTPGMRLNLDDPGQLPQLHGPGIPDFLSFRINPGISQGREKSNFLAGPDAKFGIPWEAAEDAYRQAQALGVKRFGIHMMTGSNVLEQDYFAQVTAKLLQVAAELHHKLGIDFEYINIGGGFGVPYRPEDASLDLGKIAASLRQVFDQTLRDSPMPEPRLMIEPGRYVMADAGWLVTRVTGIKSSYKKFIGVDAGMNDLPRPSIYDAYHHITHLNPPPDTPSETVNVVGRLCENNDQFARDRTLPKAQVGNLLAIHNAGAHAYAMGHNYNGRTRSAEYLLQSDGETKQIRRAETFGDLFGTVVDWPSGSEV